MAYHNPDYLMTAKEAKEHYRYMKPHAVYCDGQRIPETEYGKYILDYAEVRSGIVHYFAHKATQEELENAPKAKAEYEQREEQKRIEKEQKLIASGDAYKCPHCGTIHHLKDYNEFTPTKYICPECLDDIAEDGLEHINK